MKSYISYFKLIFINSLQYRIPAISGIFTQFFFGFVFIMVYLAFYESNSSSPMPWDQLVTYLWLQQAFFYLTYPFHRDQELLNQIKTGNLAYELIRPQNFYLKWFSKIYAKKLMGTLIRSIPIILIGFFLPYPYGLSLPFNISSLIIFLLGLLIAGLMVTAFTMIFHIIVVYTLDERGILTFLSSTMEIFMGSIIPIPFFPDWLKTIAYILPFRYLNDFPYRVYSGGIPINEGILMLVAAIIWLVIIFAIGYLLSKKVLRRAAIQGG